MIRYFFAKITCFIKCISGDFGVVVLVGALSFLPALALGPIADFFTTFK
ncbi:potassium-transporting ATPase A chain [Listeria marthii FSL S4-120]|uniref:Potassium-transporting ATPase A chain n=1 Tax=Listeria marthii FSL S4-120 TaxID=702457 RepID=A0ABP2JTF8_9LIST|nr:potassium-transporting ATPase A chain [Listeria marthii FSL S4-120]